MASEIHKKRTGKGFKISEEIVTKEEMYEEEDDDLPRHYRALTAHLHTNSPDMNSRLSAYLTGQVAMASMARQKEVDRLFAENFPNAANVGLRMQQSAYFQGLQQSGVPDATSSPTSSLQASSPAPSPVSSRSNSTARPSPLSTTHSSSNSYMHSPGGQQQLSVSDELSSPPMLSPTSGNTDSSNSTPRFQYAQYSSTPMPAPAISVEPPEKRHQSSFTSELPQDAKLLAQLDVNDPLAGVFYGIPGELDGGFDSAQFTMPVDDTFSKPQHQQQPPMFPPLTDYFNPYQMQSKFLDIPGQGSRIGTPGGGEGDSWDKWVNIDEWGYEHDGH